MNSFYEYDIQLSEGALEYLYKHKIYGKKVSLNVNFTFQIYSCVHLFQKYYSCTLFDSQSKSNNFILYYENFWEGPYRGDIINIKNINKNILKDGNHFIYLCKEIRILKKNAKFLINVDNLINMPTKININKEAFIKNNFKNYLNIRNNSNNSNISNNSNNDNDTQRQTQLMLDKKVFKRKYEISDALKIFILLSINQQNYNNNYNFNFNNFKNNSKNFEKVYLINKNIINEYKNEFEEVKYLIKANNITKYNVSNFINNDIKIEYPFINSNIFDNLMKIDESIKLININSLLNPPFEKVILINNKIQIYNEFILLKEEIPGEIKNKYSLKIIYYLSCQNKDIISIIKDTQNIILIGKMNNENGLYNIKYILDFISNQIYTNEIKLIANNVDNYIKSKFVFNDKNKNDFISPLFSNNEFIGFCYKYMPNIDYSNCINYYCYLDNKKLTSSLYIYYNYQRREKMINSNNINITKDFYLINKKYIEEIKKDCYFNEMKKLFDIYKIGENNDLYRQKLLKIIKNLPDDVINKFNKNYIQVNNVTDAFPNVKNVTYYNGIQSMISIYVDFELFEQDIIDKIVSNINAIKKYCFKCIIIGHKIIINYPDNATNRNNVSIIGRLDIDKTFITECIIIYFNKYEQNNHINKITPNLFGFLSEISSYFYYQILNEKNEFIGEAINMTYNQKMNNKNIINIKIIKKEKPQIIDKDSEYNLNSINDYPDITYNFKYPPAIGLENIGATCYMNSTLQCFCNIKKFVDFFKYSKQVANIVKNSKNNLTSSFKLLIEKLWPKNYNPVTSRKYYAPNDFKQKISKMNPLFEGIAANDAKDLVNFIIMTLHLELNKANRNNNINNNNFILDQRNKQLMLNNCVMDFKKNNQSIISDLFYAMNCNVTQCNVCCQQIYNFQTYFFIIFPLEEIRKYKNNYNNMYNIFYNAFNFFNFNNFINSNVVSIYDCFDYDCKQNLMDGENSMYCNFCKTNRSCLMSTHLITGPEVLILLLNRGHGIEFNVKINFVEHLDLSKYIEYKNTGVKYDLFGVITHIGESSMSGHFIAYCKDPILNKWHKFNDAIVSDVTNFQKEVIDFAMPYLLFYQKSQ